MIVGIVIAVIVVLLVLWAVGAYNSLVSLRNRVANGWAQIDVQLKRYVYESELKGLPWIDGVLDVLHSLKDAGVPSMLVSTSPRPIVENVKRQAGDLFAGYVCGDDPVAHKPDPAPDLEAAKRLGLSAADMPRCVVLEDSSSGLRSGVASGATVIAQTGWIRTDTSGLGQFLSIDSYDGIDVESLEAIVCRRLAAHV